MKRTFGDKIKALRSAGKTYSEIVQELGCAKSTVTFHCNAGYNARRIELQRKRRYSRKEWIIKRLGGHCTKCGYKRCVEALDIHHVDEMKNPSLQKAAASKLSIEFWEKEIEHCTLLCANCHRELHAGLVTL
jgi:predicted transcriptional regulator